jgi:hypothetical protein
MHEEFQARLWLVTWDTEQCWKELERICAEGVAKHSSSDVDYGHASRVVEALSQRGWPRSRRSCGSATSPGLLPSRARGCSWLLFRGWPAPAGTAAATPRASSTAHLRATSRAASGIGAPSE